MHLARLRCESKPGVAETVLLDFVALSFDAEPSLLAHEFREIEGDDPGIVRDEVHVVERLQFHHWNRPAAVLVHHFDPAWRAETKRGWRNETPLQNSQRLGKSKRHGILSPPKLRTFSNFTSSVVAADGGLGLVKQPHQKPRP